MSARVLYAEDTRDLSRAVCVVLEHEGFEVTACYDGAEAAAALANSAYDIAVLDIMMPKKSGIEVLREMRASGNVTPVILLTAKAEVDDRVEGLEAGADDYLPKPFAMKELVARVRSLARRNTDYGTGDLSFGDFTLSAGTYELKVHNSVRLSRVEFEMLRVFALNPGRMLSDDVLIERVWGDDGEADASAVALYVRYLRDKLQAVGSHVAVIGGEGGYSLVDAAPIDGSELA